MKKAIVLLLAACVLFSAAGCSVLNNPSSLFKPTEVMVEFWKEKKLLSALSCDQWLAFQRTKSGLALMGNEKPA